MNIEYREQNPSKTVENPITKLDVFIDGKKYGQVETGGWHAGRHWACLNTGNVTGSISGICFASHGATADEAVVNAVKDGIKMIELNTPIINELKAKFGL